MPERGDYEAMLGRHEAEKAKHVHELRTQLVPRIKDITHKAQSVVDHPGWQFYLDSIETRVQEVEGRRLATTNAMIFGKAMGHELELLKIELNTMDAEIQALRYAQTLIPQAIEAGQRVLSGVNGQAAAASVAN